MKMTLGSNHEATLATIEKLGMLYWGEGRLGAAEELLREVFELRCAGLGPSHPNAIAVGAALEHVCEMLREKKLSSQE